MALFGHGWHTTVHGFVGEHQELHTVDLTKQQLCEAPAITAMHSSCVAVHTPDGHARSTGHCGQAALVAQQLHGAAAALGPAQAGELCRRGCRLLAGKVGAGARGPAATTLAAVQGRTAGSTHEVA